MLKPHRARIRRLDLNKNVSRKRMQNRDGARVDGNAITTITLFLSRLLL